MKNVINSLAKAKSKIATIKVSKDGNNDFAHYDYFTPEQVNMLVQKVCDEFKLLTKFDLIRNEFGMYGTLTIYDLDSGESLVFEGASELPDIKATVSSQRYGGLMTYLERYLKMTAFGICSNELDLDTTENTRKVAEKKAEKDITKEGPFTEKNELPRFNEKEFELLKGNTDWVVEKDSSDELIKALETKYRLSKAMKVKVADLWAEMK